MSDLRERLLNMAAWADAEQRGILAALLREAEAALAELEHARRVCTCPAPEYSHQEHEPLCPKAQHRED